MCRSARYTNQRLKEDTSVRHRATRRGHRTLITCGARDVFLCESITPSKSKEETRVRRDKHMAKKPPPARSSARERRLWSHTIETRYHTPPSTIVVLYYARENASKIYVYAHTHLERSYASAVYIIYIICSGDSFRADSIPTPFVLNRRLISNDAGRSGRPGLRGKRPSCFCPRQRRRHNERSQIRLSISSL